MLQDFQVEQRLYGKFLLVRQALPQHCGAASPFRQPPRKTRVSGFALKKGVFPRSDARHTGRPRRAHRAGTDRTIIPDIPIWGCEKRGLAARPLAQP
jgi:hypothetical protein